MDWLSWALLAGAAIGAIRVIAVQPWRAREIPTVMSDDGKRAVHERRYPWLNSWAMDHWVAICLECGKRDAWAERDVAFRMAKMHRCESMDGWK